MGILSGLKSILGSGETVERVAEKAADGLYNGIDKLVYTDEEKAEAFAEARKAYLEFVRIAYDQNSIRSVTRRWLAWGICTWVLMNAQVAIFYAVTGRNEVVRQVIDIAEAMSLGGAFITAWAVGRENFHSVEPWVFWIVIVITFAGMIAVHWNYE